MRALIQRVSRARLTLNSDAAEPIASIGKGLLILVGFKAEDSLDCAESVVRKITNLRIFSDSAGKMNLSGAEVGAQYLFVSQFTLYADIKHGNRPSFSKAAPREKAVECYNHLIKTAQTLIGPDAVRYSDFGLNLAVELVNDGPVTLWWDL